MKRLALAALLLAGCGGAAKPAAVDRPLPPAPARRCSVDIRAQPIWFRADDGLAVDGVLLGSGPRGVIVLHGFPGTICDTIDFASSLAHVGFHVLAYDTRGFGLTERPFGPKQSGLFSADLQGAVDTLRARGAKKIFLVGFSFGGTIVAASAGQLDPPPDGVVDVSGPASLEPFFPGSLDVNGPARAHTLTMPFLFLFAHKDSRYDQDVRRLIRRAPSRDKRLFLYPGDWHAFALLYGAPYRARVQRTLLDFLRTR